MHILGQNKIVPFISDLPLILSADLEVEREAGADCTECARDVLEQVDDEESLLDLDRARYLGGGVHGGGSGVGAEITPVNGSRKHEICRNRVEPTNRERR